MSTFYYTFYNMNTDPYVARGKMKHTVGHNRLAFIVLLLFLSFITNALPLTGAHVGEIRYSETREIKQPIGGEKVSP